MRIYWMTQIIYVSTVKLEVYVAKPIIQYIFGFLLTCLLVLHIYWQYLMLGILGAYFRRGVAEDTVNDVKHVVGSESLAPLQTSVSQQSKLGYSSVPKAGVADSGSTPTKTLTNKKDQ